ncbi:DNA helicase RecQ [uncultured Ilyobacter sp.]|uniref:DNA helicase RecQ n=1 Tax=uncultured Ilyobacter sp. TaxID=544433 RepID=UPI0029BFB4F8|nr:DNA helicase RecQ [uncultured Ilyobacter sp.]
MIKINDILKKYFGYSAFREGQEEIIKNILNNKDTLGVMPTGGGKSICYQIPALIFDGITLVISPLISLMQDQVTALNALGIESVYINSSLSQKESNEIFKNISLDQYKIVYVAPERLENEYFLEQIKTKNISQIAVDEAHCISQWGHDFRKSYLGIPRFLKKLQSKPVISAFTATATPKVRDDIVGNLKFDPDIFLNGFDRKNLKFTTVKGVNSLAYIKKYLKEHKDERGIIYASTRKEVDSIYNELLSRGYKVGKYHAGLKDSEREKYQNNFVEDELDIMVATNAFGMGIDKSNVRFVIHNNLPKDIESYYQEAGRAGRDGLDANCILIFNPKDILTQRFFIENNQFDNSREIMDIKYEKLNAMVNYCHTSQCIRSYILEYFGDEKIENCNNCSNCLDTGETEDITIEAQKIISCIGRTGERFGVNIIVGILAGSKNQNILKWNLNKISTYSLMKDYKQKEIRAIIDLLIGDGYIEVLKGEFPTLKLTKKAYSFIKNRETFVRKVAKVDKKISYEGDQYFEDLKKLRYEIAKEEGKPPYTVFSDKTLHEMAKYLPLNREEMLEIHGVGEVKFDRYGTKFIGVIEKIKSSLPSGKPE